MATLSENQRRFVAGYLSASPRSNPRLVAAQLVAEEPAGARSPVGHHDQNWLNVANTDSGWKAGGFWAGLSPEEAGRRTALWTMGKLSIPGFGKAAAGIVDFAHTAGQPLPEQIAALQRSGWASSGYPNLSGLVRQVGDVGMEPATGAAVAAPFALRRRTQVDQQALDTAERRFLLGQMIASAPRSPFDIGPRATVEVRNPLLAVLPTTAPVAGDFTRTILQRIPQAGQDGAGGGALQFGHGKVILGPGADRAGVSTQPIVKRFVGLVAGSIGNPIEITTGTNHSQYTTSGNVSDHFTGHAGDIAVPVDSAQGDLIAGRALMLLGIPRAQARRMAQQGGLYTITARSGPFKGHRVQVIWKTYEGGDHHNHVHIGIQ